LPDVDTVRKRVCGISAGLVALALLGLAQAAEPEPGTPLRVEVLEAIRPRVDADLRLHVKFAVQRMNVDGGWAFLSLIPKQSNGKDIDWARTPYGDAFAEGMMSDSVLALLRRGTGGKWRIVEYALGPTDVVWEAWIPKYHLPRGFFLGETGAGPAKTAPPKAKAEQPQAKEPPAPAPQEEQVKAEASELAAKAAPAVDVEALKREAAVKNYVVALASLEAFQASGDGTQWQKGLEAAERATILDPAPPDYWRALGYAYALAADEDHFASTMAEDAFGKAVSRDPRDTAARLQLAQLQMARKSYSLALDNLEQALDIKPELAIGPVVADMCRAYIADQQEARGERFFAAVLERRPKLEAIRLGAAILLNELGKTAEAVAAARIVADDPLSAQQDAAKARELLVAWQGVSP
jgi:tetratricopeptide (TPR) repeat protein